MSSIINTNSLSLLTQNNLMKSQSSLTTAIQRLSSGLRINSAKDDAAGQAIANRFSATIKGLSQAQRNANDGISLAQTTEGALNEINNNLQRVRELTVQAANGSNSKSDLNSIQSEITQRMQEINRTSQQTDFNGTKVLGEAAVDLSIQVGAKDNETINIGLKTINTTTLGLGTGVGAAAVVSFNVNGTGTANTVATENDLTLAGFAKNGLAVAGTQHYDKTTAGATTLNVVATATNVFSKVVATGTVALNASAAPANNFTATVAGGVTTFTSGITTTAANATVQGQLIPTAGSQTSAVVTIGTTTQNIKVDSTGNITDDTGIQLYLDTTGNLTQNGGATLTRANIGKDDAGDLLKSMSNGVSNGTGTSSGGTIVANTASGTTSTYTAAAVASNTTNNFTIQTALTESAMIAKAAPGSSVVDIDGAGGVGAYSITAAGAVSDAGGAVYVGTAGALVNSSSTTAASTVEDYYVHSNGAVMDNAGNSVYADSANAGKFTLTARSGSTSTVNAIDVIDKALAKVDELRSSLGAVQNRFDSVISNLGSTVTNLSASRSRIEDADYATEVSNMTRAQILQQAGTSVLAKANQSTQGVMSLLQ
jgi:flagellin